MEAASNRKEPRPWVVDLFSTLFVAFCIGVVSAIVMGACVVLMAGEARGATDAVREVAPTEQARAKVIELVLTHHLVTQYTGLVAIDRPADRTRAPVWITQPDSCPTLPSPSTTPLFLCCAAGSVY